MEFSRRALDLIVEFEGVDQPGKWPGSASGVTIGYGYDLGYVDEVTFVLDWQTRLSPQAFDRLRRCIGLAGQSANLASKHLRDIRILQADAIEVLVAHSIPEYVDEARAAFPGFDALPLDAQGALVSLVYNRGPDLEGDRRVEMKTIHNVLADGVQAGDLAAIAKQLRLMKRLWVGKKLGGLIRRREAEAQLVESTIAPTA